MRVGENEGAVRGDVSVVEGVSGGFVWHILLVDLRESSASAVVDATAFSDVGGLFVCDV